MRIWIVLLIFPALVQAEQRIEGRLGLTESGYNKLKQYVGSKPEVRMDYYMDAFDGDNFLLYPASQPVKFRVKHSIKKTKYQVVTKTYQSQHACGRYALSVSEKESHQEKLTPFVVTRFKDMFTESMDAIGKLESDILGKLQNFQSFAFSFVTVGNHLLERELNGKRYILTPSHYARKNILKRDVMNSGKGVVEISIRKVTDFDFNNRPYVSYEVEFEPAQPEHWNAKELATFGCQIMNLDELENTDVSDTRMNRRSLTIQQLRKIGF
jgi:hypothetical protein